MIIEYGNLMERSILPEIADNYFDVFKILNVRSTKWDRQRELLMDLEIKTEIHYSVDPHRQEVLSYLSLGDFPKSRGIHKAILRCQYR